MDRLIETLTLLRTMPAGQAALWVGAGNVAVFLAALAFGHLLLALHRHRTIPPPPGPVTASEAALAAGCVAANIGVTFAGVLLWRADLLRIRDERGWWAPLDFLVLFLCMDGMMYALHRVAHHPILYRRIHGAHHSATSPRPLSLFVMNPLETLGFGALWLTLILLYPPTWAGMLAYLAANLAFGMIGHLGVEPFPRTWARLPGLRWISTSTFHHQHHRDPERNLGFYTVIWDRLFGTTSPRYPADLEDLRPATPDRAP